MARRARKSNSKLGCSFEELIAEAPAAYSYSERIADVGRVHVKLLLPQQAGRFGFRSGTVSRSEADQILQAFDPDRRLRTASNDRSAEPAYYNPANRVKQ